MSLAFYGPGGSFETRYIQYALLRDNVQHHIEGGAPTARFAALHSVSRALGGKGVRLSASALREEMRVAREALSLLPCSQLAVSAQTRAAISQSWPPAAEGTALARDVGAEHLGAGAKTLGELLGPLIDALSALTVGGSARAEIEVADL